MAASLSTAWSQEIRTPRVALSGVESALRVTDADPGERLELSVGGKSYSAVADADGAATITVVLDSPGVVGVQLDSGSQASLELRVLPGWVSVLPPMVAIFMALLLRNVLPALLLGIWLGATALISFSPAGIFRGLLDSFQIYVVDALADHDHASIILFSLMMGGMVGIITRNGGMRAIVQSLVTRAKSAIGAQVSVWFLGLLIFFDDYSNTLVVGNTARALTDHLRVSREKLAYIVDSTAAPVVCLALATTWIGYEVGLIDSAIRGIDGIDESAYAIFLRSIPYSFYPILAVLFVFFVSASGRDFGPMLKAEIRARGGEVAPLQSEDLPALQGDNLSAKDDVKEQAGNAAVPIVVVVVALVVSLYVTGTGETITEIIGSADAYRAMLWASFLGVITAAGMSFVRGVLSVNEIVDAWFGGVRALLFAMIVLILAWSLSAVSRDLQTADFLVSILVGNFSPALVPASVFVLSGATAFTTGTSWGTMAILMPLVIPLTWAVMIDSGMNSPEDFHLLYSAIACNLAGAVWGDHCSPISDTTVLSSMASGCDHIEHVRTQMPYSLLVGAVALGLGTIPAGFGISPLVLLPVGLVTLFCVLMVTGGRADEATAAAD